MYFIIGFKQDTLESMSSRSRTTYRLEDLGIAWGYFMAAVDYGLTSNLLDIDAVRLQILDYTEKIKRDLKKVNKSIKHRHIRNRLSKILSKHKDLSAKQKRLIGEIAQIFAS